MKMLSMVNNSTKEKDQNIIENREKVAKWLDTLPFVYEAELVSPERVLIQSKQKLSNCIIENNVITISNVNDKITENAENTMDVDGLLNLFEDDTCFVMDKKLD